MKGKQFWVARVESVGHGAVLTLDVLDLGENDSILNRIFKFVASNLEGVPGAIEDAVNGALSAAHRSGVDLAFELLCFFRDRPIQKAENRTAFAELDLVILEFGILYFSVLHAYIKGFLKTDELDSSNKLLYTADSNPHN